jgi:hypothetical protein
MIDPRQFKAPFLNKERIWREVDKLRSQHAAEQASPEPLSVALHRAVQIAQAAGYTERFTADDAAFDYIAAYVARQFGVSAEVAAIRLRVEKLWPPKSSD